MTNGTLHLPVRPPGLPKLGSPKLKRPQDTSIPQADILAVHAQGAGNVQPCKEPKHD